MILAFVECCLYKIVFEPTRQIIIEYVIFVALVYQQRVKSDLRV